MLRGIPARETKGIGPQKRSSVSDLPQRVFT
jgi:hypothetical protein